MKNELFQELQIGRTARCPVEHIAYPDALSGIISFLEYTGMSISLLRFGKDGIELATDPSNESAYIEYSVFFDATKYENRRQDYQMYLNQDAISFNETGSRFAREYLLGNHHSVMLYANNEKQILIYKDIPKFRTEDPKYFLTPVFLSTMQVPMNEVLSDSNLPKAEDPLSFSLPRRPKIEMIDQPLLRYDGLYVKDYDREGDKKLSAYIRFFPTGMMTGCTAERRSIAEVFTRLDEEAPCFGSYRVKEDTIEMNITGIGLDATSRLLGTIHNGTIRVENESAYIARSIWNNWLGETIFAFYEP